LNFQQASKRIDELIEEEIAQGKIPGANFVVMYKGKVLYEKAFGYQDLKQTKKLSLDSIFRIFSLSKPVTAVGILRLFEEGKLDLWDPVSKYLPGFINQKVLREDRSVWDWELKPVHRDMTLWDLLTMTSGIPYPGPECEAGVRMKRLFDRIEKGRMQGEFPSTVEIANEVGSLPLQFQPGEHWMYGFSADILGAVAEIVSGKSFDEYIREIVFEPLGMCDTGYFVPEPKRDRFCDFVCAAPDGTLILYDGNELGMEGYHHKPVFISGGAGMVSTIQDYSRFAAMLAAQGTWTGEQGNVRILGRKTAAFMCRNYLSEAQRISYNWDCTKGYGYGCLVRVLMDPGAAATNADIGEFGWDGWSGTYMSVDPKEELVMLYFIQYAGAGMTPLVRRLRSVVYGAF